MPAVVSEQPVSASEDTRALRRLTGLALLQERLDEEGKAAEQAQARRDTAVTGLSHDAEGDGASTGTTSSSSPDSDTSTDASSMEQGS